MGDVDMEPVEIVRRQEQLKLVRSTIETIWNDVERYIMPLRIGNMYIRDISENAVQLLRDDIYDSTAIYASQRMANAMHGSITNPNTKWKSRTFKPPTKLNEEPTAKNWLEGADAREWEELYESNFDPEISSAYQDLVGPGNCFMSVVAENDSPQDWAGFNFMAIPVKECFFERDHRGDMFRFYRLLNWHATEIKSKWPKEKLPAIVEKELGEGGSPDKRFDIVYAVYVRPGKTVTGKVMAAKDRPVGEQWILKETKERLCEMGGFYEMPVFHCPWEKTSGSVWGHGPGMLVSPTAKYVNNWLELEDMAVRKMIDPALLATERGIIGDLDLKPGGVTIVRDLERSLKILQSEGRIDFSKMSLKELRDSIKEAFHNDELQLRDSPQMSATEAQIRYELMNRVLGPTMGRIQTSLLSKILDRTFKTLLRNDQLGTVPDIVKQQKAQYKVVYTGALMRAQQSDEVAAIERWLGQVGAAAKIFPAVMNVVDILQWARDLAVKLNVPGKMLRSVADVEAMVKQQQETAAAQARSALQAQKGAADKAQGEGQQALQEAKQVAA